MNDRTSPERDPRYVEIAHDVNFVCWRSECVVASDYAGAMARRCGSFKDFA
jgi:hypothetical protein